MIAAFEASLSELDQGRASPCPIVGIGVAAGDSDSIRRLLERIPPDTGMAFVFVQPAAAGDAGVVAASRTMPVVRAGKNTQIKANQAYLVGPNAVFRLTDSGVCLAVSDDQCKIGGPIDCLLRSLAQVRGRFAIGVVLAGADFAGMDSDGLGGLQAIHNEGGIAIVQRESSGLSAMVLPLEQIAAQLIRIASDQAANPPGIPAGAAAAFLQDPDQQRRLLQLLLSATHLDFSGYDRRMILRPIAWRMAAVGHRDFESWLAWLGSNPGELAAMGEDLLRHVASLNPEKETFDIFRQSILPCLLDSYEAWGEDRNIPFRVWVPGCSTGQEVYSIAMCLAEAMEARGTLLPVSISGTDVSEEALAIAHEGVYPEREIARHSPARQARFFARVKNGFQVIGSVREMCVFTRRNLLGEPPLQDVSLIVCRGILSWLPRAMQREAITAFHSALQPAGSLWLGHSESVLVFPELFSPVDHRRQFYFKGQPKDTDRHSKSPGQNAAERIVLSEFGPAWVLLNEDLGTVHASGDLAAWLDLSRGDAHTSLRQAAHDGFRAALTRVMEDVRTGGMHCSSAILQLADGGAETRVEVRRVAAADEDTGFVVVFLPASHSSPEPGALPPRNDEQTPAGGRPRGRFRQLDARRGELIGIVERNEESQSGLRNENGAPETSQMECLANNQELNAVNKELLNRIENLARLSDDLATLLSSTTIPILMLDNELRIRRITPAAEALFGIRRIDVGRPLRDIRLRIREEHLDSLVRKVIGTRAGEEIEILDHRNRCHLLRIRPYRTTDDRIEGAVLAMIDIDEIRRAQNTANAAREFAESLIESVPTPLVVLNRDLRVRMANPIFLSVYGLRLAAIENLPLDTLGADQWNSPELRAALQRLARGETHSEDLEVAQPAAGTDSRRIVMINARRIASEDAAGRGDRTDGSTVQKAHRRAEFGILLAAVDITSQRRAEKITFDERETLRQSVQEREEALRRNREELRALTASLLNAQDEERRRVSRELHDDVSQNLAKLQFDIEMLEQNLRPELAQEKSRLLMISEGFGQLSNELRRIAYALHPSTLDHLGLAVALRAYCREFAKRSGLRIRFTAAQVPAQFAPEIASSLYRITQEALRNGAKHAPDSTVIVRLTGRAASLKLTIRDNGPGFDREGVRGKGGLGLISMQERARLIHAAFQLTTEPGAGTTITVAAPLS